MRVVGKEHRARVLGRDRRYGGHRLVDEGVVQHLLDVEDRYQLAVGELGDRRDEMVAVREQALVSARLTEVRAVPVRSRAGGV